MAEQDDLRQLIKRGEERLSHSKSILERLKTAERRTASILHGKPRKQTKSEPTLA